MQTSKLTQGIQDFTTKVFSKDPVEYNSAINLYLEPQAHYESALVKTHGASRIKKLIALEKLFVRKRELRRNIKKSGKGGVEGWDEANQIMTLPTWTTYSLPFALPLIDIVFTLPSTLILHLNLNEDGEVEDEEDAALHSEDEIDTTDTNGELKLDGETERRLVVTKWEDRSVLDSVLNKNQLVKNLYTSLVLPFLSYALCILAGALFFYRTHRLSNGLFKYAVDASHEVFHAIQSEIPRFMSGDRITQSSRALNQAASLANAYYQSGKLDAERQLNHLANDSSPDSKTESLGSSSAVQPGPSSPSPNMYKAASPPSLRVQSPPRATTSSSLTHAHGEHVVESHTTTSDNDGVTSYATAVAEGSQVGNATESRSHSDMIPE